MLVKLSVFFRFFTREGGGVHSVAAGIPILCILYFVVFPPGAFGWLWLPVACVVPMLSTSHKCKYHFLR